MNRRQALLALSLLALAAPITVQAQTIGWMDRLFTFRENQKPNPNSGARASRPTYVTQPAYNPTDHVQWSNFYSNPNLAAQDYMIGSASKVMRPAGTGMTMASADQVDAMGQRALQNTRQQRPDNIMIGEPGEFMSEGGNLGRATQVGEPTHDWRNGSAPRMSSRPGDYDYEATPDRRGPLADGGSTLAETTPGMSVPMVVSPSPTSALPTRDPNGPYVAYNAENQVTRYAVQRGDTLGSIAAQPEIYNEAALWPLIYTANRKVIGSNPHRLKVKSELSIPRDYTPTQAKQARQRAGRR